MLIFAFEENVLFLNSRSILGALLSPPPCQGQTPTTSGTIHLPTYSVDTDVQH